MTPHEFIKQRESEVEDLHTNWNAGYWVYLMEQYARNHTLTIAEEAVGEVVNDPNNASLYRAMAMQVGNDVLTKIRNKVRE